jgi:hypothetical protein
MCGECWNADTFADKVKKYGKEACDGSDMLFMSLSELKELLTKDAKKENKSSYRIFNKAITDLPNGINRLDFTPSESKKTIQVQFV